MLQTSSRCLSRVCAAEHKNIYAHRLYDVSMSWGSISIRRQTMAHNCYTAWTYELLHFVRFNGIGKAWLLNSIGQFTLLLSECSIWAFTSIWRWRRSISRSDRTVKPRRFWDSSTREKRGYQFFSCPRWRRSENVHLSGGLWITTNRIPSMWLPLKASGGRLTIFSHWWSPSSATATLLIQNGYNLPSFLSSSLSQFSVDRVWNHTSHIFF